MLSSYGFKFSLRRYTTADAADADATAAVADAVMADAAAPTSENEAPKRKAVGFASPAKSPPAAAAPVRRCRLNR
jgi:hypothetical protein